MFFFIKICGQHLANFILIFFVPFCFFVIDFFFLLLIRSSLLLPPQNRQSAIFIVQLAFLRHTNKQTNRSIIKSISSAILEFSCQFRSRVTWDSPSKITIINFCFCFVSHHLARASFVYVLIYIPKKKFDSHFLELFFFKKKGFKNKMLRLGLEQPSYTYQLFKCKFAYERCPVRVCYYVIVTEGKGAGLKTVVWRQDSFRVFFCWRLITYFAHTNTHTHPQ